MKHMFIRRAITSLSCGNQVVEHPAFKYPTIHVNKYVMFTVIRNIDIYCFEVKCNKPTL